MVNNELVNLIQTTVDTILDDLQDSTSPNYDEDFDGYTCNIYNEINYKFIRATPKVIEANILCGSAQKNNDLADKYNMPFVINIQSEINGGMLAKKLFDLVFVALNRTYHTLGDYKSKIYFTSPVIMQVFNEIESNFNALLTMNCSVEFSKNVVLGATYQLSLDGTNYIRIYPRQPYCMKEATGGVDTNWSNKTQVVFSKQGNAITINLVLIYQQVEGETLTTEETNFNSLFNALLNECYGNSNQKYYYKETTGTITKTITNLICVRGQKIYDETNGENVLSIQLKVGA